MGVGSLWLDSCIMFSDMAIFGTFAAVFSQLNGKRSAEGMSLQTLIAVVSARVIHLGSQLLGIHYRPTDFPSSIYLFSDIVNAAAGVACIALFVKCRSTYEVEKDNFGIHLFDRLKLVPEKGFFANRTVLAGCLIYAVTFALAFLWSLVRKSSGAWHVNYYCCIYEALCMVALIPQLWMFHQDKLVNQLLGTFVVMVALNRLCTLAFWVTYTWVNPWSAPANRGIQIFTELLNLAVLADFLYYWARAKLRGETRIRIGTDPDV
eukprot:TRINITY_DN21106_c0_g1_i1.p1 TRINITY_DN21106_c0_g1~~TRINITY_DN21106_c0_g1_i1.p1  ORF type:complete len:263 (+),score=43.64 TRINITY_DN21106_c0_g1_i1:112-900(+)